LLGMSLELGWCRSGARRIASAVFGKRDCGVESRHDTKGDTRLVCTGGYPSGVQHCINNDSLL
jgi:hypothetical protein